MRISNPAVWLTLPWAWLAVPGCAGTAGSVCNQGDLELSGSRQLEASCTYQGTLWIVASDVVLDCRGALIDARGRENGVIVGGKHLVTNVVVRNCTVEGGRNGIYIGLLESDAVKAARHDHETLYQITPHDILIEHVTVRDSDRVGIFVDDYASHARIVASTITGSGSAGIYLEHSSRENEILQSVIADNGYGRFPFYRFGASRREGIAVDSSARNRIEGNRISGNAAGGIFLYKNCHEYARTNHDSVPRWQHSDHNLIRDNHVEDEPVGVWLASRQSRDLSSWGCGDKPYLGQRYYPDYAQHNLIEANIFMRVRTGVLIEDDYNTVSKNRFVDAEIPVALGAKYRQEVTGLGLEGIVIEDNNITR